MFNLAIFANPAQLKREFLSATDVAKQPIGTELNREFNHIREENPDLHMSGNFWWDYIRSYKKHLATILFGRTLIILMVLALVLISQQILKEDNTLATALWMLFLFAVVQIVWRIINAWTAMYQGQMVVNTRTFIILRFNTKLLRMGQLSSNEFSTGNLKTLISSDFQRVGQFLAHTFRNGIPCLLSLLILGPAIVAQTGWPGIVAIIVAFSTLPLAILLGHYVHKQEAKIKRQEDDVATLIGEWVVNVRALRFLNWENLMRSRIAQHVHKLVTEAVKQHGVNLISFSISITWWLFPIIALIWATQVDQGEQALIAIFGSIWMLNHITLYIRTLPDLYIRFAAATACVNRLNALFRHHDIKDELLPANLSITEQCTPVKLHFHKVSYRYEGETKSAIDKLDLSINLNDKISLIGRVGSGKSTFLKLLSAEIKPTEGEIVVEFDNGQRANLWHENMYRIMRTTVGYMPQEAYLSNATLAANVALDTIHHQDHVLDAVRMAEMEADILHWTHGTDEEVGETGVNLSGGQKQRVNLARALYSGRPWLVLDDPLSAVDTNTEGKLMKTLNARTEGYVICSHRLKELIQTDRLLVMEKGRIIEDGKPQQLLLNQHSHFSQQVRAGEDLDLLGMQPV